MVIKINILRCTVSKTSKFDIQISSLLFRQELATYGRKIKGFLRILLAKNEGVFDLLDDVTTILRTFSTYRPADTTWLIVRLESSASPLSELQILQVKKCWRVPKTCPESLHWRQKWLNITVTYDQKVRLWFVCIVWAPRKELLLRILITLYDTQRKRIQDLRYATLTLILLTWRIGWAHNNARK